MLSEPIVMPIPTTDDYKILDWQDNILYVGRITAMPNQTGIPQVDIAPIVRQIVPSPNYEQVLQSAEDGDIGYTKDPTEYLYRLVTAPTDPNNAALEQRTTFGVYWDYMSPVAEQEFRGMLGGGIQDYVLPGQMFGLSFNSDNQWRMGNTLVNIGTTVMWVQDIEQYNKVIIEDPETSKQPRIYDVKQCAPENACILYYVDGDGGLAWVICDAKNTTTENIERDQITHENDIDNPTHFGIDNYRITAYKSYTLNTGYLTDKQSERLQWLFKSPKVWLYKIGISSAYNAGEQWNQSVVITDKKMQIKRTKSNGKLFNYTIQCRDSQTHEITG